MKNTSPVIYKSDGVFIKEMPLKGSDIQVFARPTDKIEFSFDIKNATYQIVGGDILLKLPDAGTITFVSMGLLAFQENNVLIKFPSGVLTLDQILSQIDEVKETPVESLITDEFVALNKEFSTEQSSPVSEQNDNFSKILEEPVPQQNIQKYKNLEDDLQKPSEEFEENDFNALLRQTDDNPANVNFSAVENAVEAGLKFTLTAYQTSKQEKVSGTTVVRVDGGGGSEYGAQVDTPEAQFQPETLDYSDKTNAMVIYADSPKLFKVNALDLSSQSQLSRDLSIKPEQPIGFGISSITISNLPEGFKIVGATYSNGVWNIPKAVYDADGNLVSDGFTVNINTGKARFTMTYPDDLADGEEITAIINFTSTFDTANLLPGESVDTPDISSLDGQGRLQFVTKTIDWDSPTGFEDFIDDDERVVLATNPNNNIVLTSHGDNTVYGGDGKDTVVAQEGNDTIFGAKGDDTLDGGSGNDTLFGDTGDDVLQGKTGNNTLDGGEGTDTIDYSYISDTAGVDVDLLNNIGSNSGENVFDTIYNVEKVVGSQYADHISGDEAANILLGEDGKDTIYGDAGSDTLEGGNDDDVLFGGIDNDTLLGGVGADLLDGGSGSDTLLGELGNDTLMWDSGDDTLDGGVGSDMVDFSNYNAEVIATINGGVVTVNGGSDRDTIINMEIIRGSLYNDTINGGLEDNTLYGNSGDDILDGHDGNDILHGDAGSDTLIGGKGLDLLEGNDGDDLLRGEQGADRLDGGNGIDTADYSYEGSIATTLNLGNYVAVNVDGGDNDLIRNIENIVGSNIGGDTITGDSLVNIISGQGGNDTLDGGGADDTLFGGGDDDILRGGKGNDLLDGGSETNVGDTADYTNQERIVVSMNSSGADTTVDIGASGEQDTLRSIENITGSNDDSIGDTIVGNEENNILKGLKGDDTLNGSFGDDYLDGGFGDDTLIGGDDQDTLKGSFGDDYLEGGRGVDILEGGDGIDVVSYQHATNRVDVHLDTGTATGDGIDTIYDVENVIGSTYNDTIVGNDSINTLFGSDGDDFMFGGIGNDTLYGEDGADTLSGGEGEDYLYGGDLSNIDNSTADMASYKNVNSGVGIRVDLTKDNSNASNAVVANDGYNSVDYLYDIENIQGSDSKDFIIGDIKDNYLLGEEENDTLYGGAGIDTLDGGFGDDIFRAEAGDDTVIGGDGVDTIDYSTAINKIAVDLGDYDLDGYNVSDDGEGGRDRLVGVENIIGTNSIESDTIIGDSTNNYIEGLDGDDTLKGSSGLDTLDGGDGNDTLMGGADSDRLIGGAGDHDIVDFSDLSINGVYVDLENSFATGNGNDIIESVEDIRGSIFKDTLSGDDNINTIYAGAGDDILNGRSGDDLLYGEAGDDTLRGDAGADTLYGGDDKGNDTGSDTADYSTVINNTDTGIRADLSLANNQVSEDGYGFSDTLNGIENISGTSYNDIIRGSDRVAEINILSGNEGDDSFVFSDGKDSIRGGAGSDTIDYSALANSSSKGLELDFDVVGVQKSIIKETDSGIYSDLVEDIEHVIGTLYDDTFTGGSGANVFEGRDGDDIFFGKSGMDKLYGEEGDDTLDGGDDNDTLLGGVGDDTLIGGSGDDFIDGGMNSGDRDVADYTAAASKISLDLDNSQVVGADTGRDTLINVEVILATNYEDTLVGDNAKNVLDGRASNDTILGQDGDDTLIGYTGGDTINGGLGSDLLIGGSDANDADTVGFNEVSVGGATIADINSVVTVDLNNQNARIISVSRTDIADTSTYSFDLTDPSGVTATISYSAQNGDSGDIVIQKLNDAIESAGLSDIKVFNDVSNSPNIDVYETSHRLLIMDTSVNQNGLYVTNETNVLQSAAGTATSLNTLTGVSEIDYLFDFDNIKGSDISGSNLGDTLTGNSGDNKIYAGDGDDTIFSTNGADYLDGEGDTKSSTNPDGGDWVDYSNQSAVRVNVTLDAGNGDGTGSDNFNNTLINIENIRGTDALEGDTIIGDDGNNIIEGGNNGDGTYDRDTIHGAGGDDTLYGQDGRDVLAGDDGDDTLYGGADNDMLYGGTGVDQYDGGDGYDIVDYYNTPFLLDLQNSSRIDANGDNATSTFVSIEEIYGSDSQDEIIVDGDMNISARGGDDILKGGDGSSRIYGGDGNDIIDGGNGDDILSGGRHNDTFFASRGVDTIDGGDYTDTIDFRDDRTYTGLDSTTQSIGTNTTEGIYVDFRITEDINSDGTDDYGKITNNGFGEVSYIRNVENLEATQFNDTFVGNGSKNIVNLYDGDDRVFLSDGGDTIDGGDNNALSSGGGDWIDASNVTSGGSIYLAYGTEYIGSPSGKIINFEHIKASTYDDYMLQGNSEDNSILGMAGNDTLVGRDGNDYLDGGDGNDTVSYSSNSGKSPAAITVHYDTTTKTVDDGYGDRDTLVSIETVIGSKYNDVFYGSDGSDTFLSGGGQDSFIGSLGDDFLSGNEGGVAASKVDYSGTATGNKLILDLSASSNQAELVKISDGSKYFTDQLQDMKNVIATVEDDTLTGSVADNSLYGLAGDDTFFATDGNDTYDGGAEADGDWVDYSIASTDIVSDLDAGSTSKGINGSSDGLNSIEHIITGSGNDTITAATSNNTIIANDGDDTIYSNDGNNVFFADDTTTPSNEGTQDTIRYDKEDTGDGVKVNIDTDNNYGIGANSATNAYGKSDILYNFENIVGSANSDTLIGSNISNSINGGAGADMIVGAEAADVLVGAAGDDTFIFTDSEFGADTTVKGGDDIDTLQITDQANVTDADFAKIAETEKLWLSGDDAHNVVLGSNADATGIIAIDASAVSNSNSVTLDLAATGNDQTITGGSGADTISLGTGASTLQSGDGNDTVIYTSNSRVNSADNLDTGGGTDTLFVNNDEDFDLSSVTMSNVETLKFTDNAIDQSVTINADQSALLESFVSNDSDEDVLKVQTDNVYVDLSTKTFTNVENSEITQSGSQTVHLTGNDATKDTINAGSGDDILSGLGDNDSLIGNAGDDTFLDGSGDDYISGGTGEDTIEFSAANFTSEDTLDGGENALSDTLSIVDKVTMTNLTDSDFANVSNIKTLEIGADEEHQLSLGTDFSNSGITVINVNSSGSNSVSADLNGVSSEFTLTTGNGNDNIVLGSAKNVVYAQFGDDVISVSDTNLDSNDTIYGEDGTDTLVISDMATITSSDISHIDVEELLSGATDDEVDITAGNAYIDTITTGAGDDTVKIKENALGATQKLDGGDDVDTLDITGNVDLSGLEVVNFENITSDSDLSLSVEQANGKSIMATGNAVSIVANPTSSDTLLDASNISADTLAFTNGIDYATTVTGVNINVDASGIDTDLDITLNDVDNLNVTSGSGATVTLDATALSGGKSITVDGDGLVAVSIDNDTTLSAATATGDIRVTDATSGNNSITTGDGADTVTSSSGADTIATGAGDDVVNLKAVASSVDGGSDKDILNLQIADDFSTTITNIDTITASEDVTLSGSVDSDLDVVEIASGKTVTTNGSLIDNNSFDFTGAGNVNISALTQDDLDGIGFKNSGTLTLSTDGAEIDITAIDTTTTSLSTQSKVSLVGGADSDTFTINENLDNDTSSIDGNEGVDTLNINGTVDFSKVSISEIEVYNINETNDLSGKIDAEVTEINVAAAKTATITGADIDSKTVTIDLADAASKVVVENASGNGFENITLDGTTNTSNAGTAMFNAKSAGGTIDVSSVDISNFSNGVISIVGKDGDDVIKATAAADTIIANAGDDTITAGAGVDIIDGGSGNDLFKYASESEFDGDSLVGGSDKDTIELTLSGDYDLTKLDSTNLSDIEVLKLDDTINVTLDNMQLSNLDSIIGSSGNDKLIVDDGSSSANIDLSQKNISDVEVLEYGANGDTIILSEAQIETSGTKFSTITGGAGSDTLAFSAATDIDLRSTTFSSIETIKLVDDSSDESVTLNDTQLVDITAFDGSQVGGIKEVVVEAGNTQDLDLNSLTFSNIDDVRLNIASGASHTFTTTDLKDIITIGGTDGNSVISGAGDDTVTGSSDDDWISSGADNDSVIVGSGADTVDAGEGDDTIEIAVASMAASDTLEGGSGSDVLQFAAGSGGTVTAAEFANVTNIEIVRSGDNGLDLTLNDSNNIQIVDASQMTSSGKILSVDTTAETDVVSIIGGANDDTMCVGNNDTLSAGGGDDTIKLTQASTSYNNSIDGGSGSDTLSIVANDVLFSGTLTSVEVVSVDATGADLRGEIVSSVTEIDVSAGNDITLTGADLKDETIELNHTGTGTVNVVNTNTTANDFDAITLTQGTLNITASAGGTVNITGLTKNGGTVNLIGTDAGDETFIIDGVVVDSVNGSGNNTNDTLIVRGNVDLSGATLSNLKTITVDDGASLTLSSTQVNNANEITANGTGVVHIDDNATATVDLTGVSAPLILDSTIAGALTFNNVATDIDATADTKDVTINVVSPMTYTTGSGSNTVNETLNDGEVVTIKGDDSVTVNLTNGDVDATVATGAVTVNDGSGSNVIKIGSGADIVNIDDSTTDTVETNAGADTINITKDFISIDGGGDSDTLNINADSLTVTGDIKNIETIKVNKDADLSGATVNNTPDIVVAASKTLTLGAADIANYNTISGDGKLSIKSGSGTINVANVTTSMIVLASALSASVTLDNLKTSVDGSAHAEGATLNIDDSVDLASQTLSFKGGSGATDTLNATLASAEGVGSNITVDANIESVTLTLGGNGTSSIDAENIASKIILKGGSGGDVTLTNVSVEVDGSNFESGENLSVKVTDTDGVTVTTGAGTNTIDAEALSDGHKVVVLGDDSVTVNLGAGDVDASGMSGTPTVTVNDNGSGASNVITTAGGNDVINLGDGDDTVDAKAGDDLIKIDGNNLGSGDTIDGGDDSDTLEITANGTIADADFTNISNFESVTLTSGDDAITLGSYADSALSDGATVSGGDGSDTFTLDFGLLGKFILDGGTAGTNSDVVAITGINSGDTVADNIFDNIEKLDLTALDTQDTLDITFNNLNSWKESGVSEFTIDVNDDGSGNINTGQQFDQVDYNGTTNITTLGDYDFTDGTSNITLHVV